MSKFINDLFVCPLPIYVVGLSGSRKVHLLLIAIPFTFHTLWNGWIECEHLQIFILNNSMTIFRVQNGQGGLEGVEGALHRRNCLETSRLARRSSPISNHLKAFCCFLCVWYYVFVVLLFALPPTPLGLFPLPLSVPSLGLVSTRPCHKPINHHSLRLCIKRAATQLCSLLSQNLLNQFKNYRLN